MLKQLKNPVLRQFVAGQTASKFTLNTSSILTAISIYFKANLPTISLEDLTADIMENHRERLEEIIEAWHQATIKLQCAS